MKILVPNIVKGSMRFSLKKCEEVPGYFYIWFHCPQLTSISISALLKKDKFDEMLCLEPATILSFYLHIPGHHRLDIGQYRYLMEYFVC